MAVKFYKKIKVDYSNDFIFSSEGKKPDSSKGFGVIMPYKSQLQVLRQAFDRAGVSTGEIEIDTIDAFQGHENGENIFSCVRSSVTTGISFVRDVRHINVVPTRARSSVIVLGIAQTLSEGSKDRAAFVEDAYSHGCTASNVYAEYTEPECDDWLPPCTNEVSTTTAWARRSRYRYGATHVGRSAD